MTEVNLNEMTTALTDAEIAGFDAALDAAQVRAKVPAGPMREVQRLDLLQHIARAPSGELHLTFRWPIQPAEPQPQPGNTLEADRWLQVELRSFDVAAGIALYLGPGNPLLDLARRERILFDRRRRDELARIAAQAAARAAQEAREVAFKRQKAWQALVPAERAQLRLGETFSAADFARLLVIESKAPTLPPDGWQPATVPAVVTVPEESAELRQ